MPMHAGILLYQNVTIREETTTCVGMTEPLMTVMPTQVCILSYLI